MRPNAAKSAKANNAAKAINAAKANITAKANIPPNVTNTKSVNSTYCNGFPIRKFFAIVILILNIVSLCTKLFTPSFFYFLIFVDILYVSLWAYFGYYHCRPITTFFVQLGLMLVLLILMPFFLMQFMFTQLSASIGDASLSGGA